MLNIGIGDLTLTVRAIIADALDEMIDRIAVFGERDGFPVGAHGLRSSGDGPHASASSIPETARLRWRNA
jgi:hypothetical protein